MAFERYKTHTDDELAKELNAANGRIGGLKSRISKLQKINLEKGQEISAYKAANAELSVQLKEKNESIDILKNRATDYQKKFYKSEDDLHAEINRAQADKEKLALVCGVVCSIVCSAIWYFFIC